jgi:hypothetical protein
VMHVLVDDLLFLTLLLCILCHMHHGIFLITLVHNVLMQRFRGGLLPKLCAKAVEVSLVDNAHI